MTIKQSPLCRSLLYIPGSRPRALEKAMTLDCDGIIFDLEDAVTPDEKPAARQAVIAALTTRDYGARLRIVRVNGLGAPWGRDDVRALADAAHAGVRIDALLMPKISFKKDLDAVVDLTSALPIWAMMETALGMLNAPDIASHPQLQGMVVGTNDLARDMGARFRPDRLPMMAGLGLCLLAAKSFGKPIIDGVYNTIDDAEGLRIECTQGRDMGFDGKTLIHPAQLAIANDVFGPSADEVALARRHIAAFADAEAAGQGVAVVDGRIVEALHVTMARETLAKAEAIAARS